MKIDLKVEITEKNGLNLSWQVIRDHKRVDRKQFRVMISEKKVEKEEVKRQWLL